MKSAQKSNRVARKALLLLTGCGLLNACGGGSAQGRHSLDGGAPGWRKLAALGKGPRQETAVAALGGRIYVLGGFTDTLAIVNRVEAYDPAADEWVETASLPIAMHHANVAVVNERIYVVGALIGGGFTAIGDAFVYDPGANGWTQLTSMPLGTERGAAGTAVIGTKIYVAGGFRQNRSVADFSAYDTANDSWEILPSIGEPRDHLIAAAAADRFYAVGGRRNGALRGNVDEFDPAKGKWTAKTPMLTARAGTAGAAVINRILVAGGEGNPNVPTGVFPDNEAYDLLKDSWERLDPMLTPRHGTGAAVLNDVLYLPGGATRQGFGAVDTNEAYRP
jgi:N-acetylneuraminic acid mutarotase